MTGGQLRAEQVTTILISLGLLGAVAWSIAVRAQGDPLDALERPSATAMRVVERRLQAGESVPERCGWQGVLLAWGLGPVASDRARIASDLRGLVDYLQVHALGTTRERALLAVLLFELGRDAEAEEQLGQLRRGRDTEALHQAIRAAYTSHVPPEPQALALLGDGWARDRVTAEASRLAEEAPHGTRPDPSGIPTWTLALLALAVTVAGAVLLMMDQPQGKALAPIPARWGVADAYATVVRGVAVGIILLSIVYMLDLPLVGCWPSLLIAVPTVAAIRIRLILPQRSSLSHSFGLSVAPRKWLSLTGLLAVTLIVEQLGGLLVLHGCSLAGWSGHWTEYVIEDMIWASPYRLVALAADIVVWAPLLEEVVFRGTLYAALRRRAPPWLALLVTSAGFGLLHPYSVPGILVVTWSGAVWAVAYEKTHSLWPCIIGHAASNLCAVGAIVSLYR